MGLCRGRVKEGCNVEGSCLSAAVGETCRVRVTFGHSLRFIFYDIFTQSIRIYFDVVIVLDVDSLSVLGFLCT